MISFVGDEITAAHVDSESQSPFVVGNVTAGVGRHEDASRDCDTIQAAIR